MFLHVQTCLNNFQSAFVALPASPWGPFKRGERREGGGEGLFSSSLAKPSIQFPKWRRRRRRRRVAGNELASTEGGGEMERGSKKAWKKGEWMKMLLLLPLHSFGNNFDKWRIKGGK